MHPSLLIKSLIDDIKRIYSLHFFHWVKMKVAFGSIVLLGFCVVIIIIGSLIYLISPDVFAGLKEFFSYFLTLDTQGYVSAVVPMTEVSATGVFDTGSRELLMTTSDFGIEDTPSAGNYLIYFGMLIGGMVGAFGLYFCGRYFYLGMIRVNLGYKREEEIAFSPKFGTLSMYTKQVLLSFLAWLPLIIIGLNAIIGWFHIAFIGNGEIMGIGASITLLAFIAWIPLIFYMVRIFLCYYVIADEARYPNITLGQAIEESRTLTRGHIFTIGFSFIVVGFLVGVAQRIFEYVMSMGIDTITHHFIISHILFYVLSGMVFGGIFATMGTTFYSVLVQNKKDRSLSQTPENMQTISGETPVMSAE